MKRPLFASTHIPQCIIVLAGIMFLIIPANAREIALESGAKLLLVLDGIEEDIALGKPLTHMFDFAFDSKNGPGNINFRSIENTGNGQKWDFSISGGQIGEQNCVGVSPKSNSFITGSCNGRSLFVLLPALGVTPGNTRPPPAPVRRIGTQDAGNLAREATVDIAADPNSDEKQNVDVRHQPGDSWLSEIIFIQQTTIDLLFASDAQSELYRNIPEDCQEDLRCQVKVHQRIIERAVQILANQ